MVVVVVVWLSKDRAGNDRANVEVKSGLVEKKRIMRGKFIATFRLAFHGASSSIRHQACFIRQLKV